MDISPPSTANNSQATVDSIAQYGSQANVPLLHCSQRLIHFSTAIPDGCWGMLDICMNKSREDLYVGPEQCFMTPVGIWPLCWPPGWMFAMPVAWQK